jgi:hypothetical protein
VRPLVVLPPLLGVRQDFVGLLDLLEMLLGSGVFGVRVRMVLADQPAVRFADVVLRGPSGQPEQLIKVLGGLLHLYNLPRV